MTHLSSVGTKGLDARVLTGYLNVGTEGRSNEGKVGHGNTDNDVNIVGDRTSRVERLDKGGDLLEGEVALKASEARRRAFVN